MRPSRKHTSILQIYWQKARSGLKELLDRGKRSRPPEAPRPPRRRIAIKIEPGHIYAIGDIHGCYDKLRGLEDLIVQHASSLTGTKLLVYLGDYIDRGPSSAAVIDHLLSPPPPGFLRVALCGNHEDVLVDIIDGQRSLEGFLQWGGDRTLLSYGLDLQEHRFRHRHPASYRAAIREALPERHKAFLASLPVSFSTPRFLFVHAGVRPGIPLAHQTEGDLLWIRNESWGSGDNRTGRIVVHGHTPGPEPVIDRDRICIDTGAYMDGPLTAAYLSHETAEFLSYNCV